VSSTHVCLIRRLVPIHVNTAILFYHMDPRFIHPCVFDQATVTHPREHTYLLLSHGSTCHPSMRVCTPAPPPHPNHRFSLYDVIWYGPKIPEPSGFKLGCLAEGAIKEFVSPFILKFIAAKGDACWKYPPSFRPSMSVCLSVSRPLALALSLSLLALSLSLSGAGRGGDAEELPAGCGRKDVFFLRSIMHDWDDAHCLNILRALHSAIGTSGAALLLVDVPLPPPKDRRDSC
jgi:O-methyltransferase domain